VTSRRRYSAVVSAICLGLAFVVGCGDGAYDEAVSADATIADQNSVADLSVGDSGGADGDAVTIPDSSDIAAPDALDVAQDVATLAKLEISKPAAGAIVNPASTLEIRGKLADAPQEALSYTVTDESGAVLASGDVTDVNAVAVDLPAPVTPGTHKWTVTVQKKADGSAVAKSEIVFTVNTLPTAPQVSIQPQPASAKDALQAQVDVPATDADGQPITYSYVWSKDGQPSGDTGASLPKGKAKKGEVWTVAVVANDGIGQGPAGTATITVGNAAPEPAALAPMATEVGLEGTITAKESGAASDIDGDALTLTWVWTVDGVVVPGVNSPSASVAELAAALGKPIAVGAVIGVAQKVSDGEASASSAVSKVTVVQGTACATLALAPHVVCTENGTTAPDLSCDSKTIGNGLFCLTISGLPQDSTPVVASTATVAIGLGSDGTPTQGPFEVEVYDANGKLVGSGSFGQIDAGQSVQAQPSQPGLNQLTVIVKKDGKVAGTWSADVYQNTPPTAPELALQPNPAQSGDSLSAKLSSPSQDIDTSLNQAITYTYTWTVDGKPTSHSGETLPAGLVKKGELWQVTVTPNDGVENGPSASAFLTIGNAPPKAPILTAAAAEVGLLGTIKLSLDAQTVDADGDAVTTTLVWKVDGVEVKGISGLQATVSELAKAGAKIQVGSVISVVATSSDGASQASSQPVVVAVIASDAVCSSAQSPCAAGTQCTENGTFAPKCACASPKVGNGIVCLAAQIPAVGLAGATTQVQAALDIGSGAQGPLTAELRDADGKVLAQVPVKDAKAALQAALLAGAQAWTVAILDANGTTVATATQSVFADTPPSAPVVVLGPAQATVLSGVQLVEVKASDIDAGQSLSYTFQWLKDGKPTGLTAADLPPGTAKKGEVWTLIAVASDGIATGLPGQATVLIANAAPGEFAAELPPKTDLLSTLTVKLDPSAKSDADGDPLSYSVQWFVDGEEVPGQSGLSIEVAKIKLASGKILKLGAKIWCIVAASDGSISTSATSNTAIVEGGGADVCKAFNPCDKNAVCINNGTLAPDCACNSGYAGNGLTCSDVNECLTNNGDCDPNAACSNTVGSNTCACKAGFTGDGKTCGDINECLTNNGGCSASAQCTNTPGGNTCACKLGYTGDGKSCTDVNECLSNNGGCSANAQCTNTPGANTCACKAGFSGDGKTCSDVNECAVGNGGCDVNAACTNSVGSFACACKSGYSGDGKTCSDINECAVNNGGCSNNAACTNSPGAFACSCKAGYSGDGKTCNDVNECATNNGGCDTNALCSNSAGSFSCACKAGFSGDGKSCSDVNECASNNGGCSNNASCTNSVGSFVCACKAGYSGDGKTCTDINECATSNGGCDANALCSNTAGSFTCACKSGFSGDGKSCSDVNECASNNGGCSANATCSNSVGSFSCACKTGYSGDGKTCTDVNECATNNGGCSANATCSNTPGSFSCSCKTGYTGNGTTCSDVNECATNNGGCSNNATCTNSVGSFSCSCKTGYTGNGTTCSDINECLVNNGGCAAQATCTNTPGSFQCGSCPAGYSGDGVTCSDINECATNNGGCDSLTTCTNKPGSYSCSACPAGYTGTGATGCVDINECAVNNGGCDKLTTCSNKPGTFSCGACPSGYTGTGATGCVDVNECAVNNGGCDKLTTCSNTAGSFSCGACPKGYSGSGATGCSDINECATNNGGCDKLTTCTNSVGSFSCGACPAGYTGTGATGCTDVNECSVNNGGCSVNANCSNTAGSFSCSCKAGYSGDGKTCNDVNECATNNGGCSANATCTNTTGSFSCSCKTGFSGDGVTCNDVNECATNNGGCSANATCTNTTGSFSCSCKTGYTGNGVTCTDINECATNNGGCSANATCTNSAGSFSCACKTGYTGNGVTCTDVNECATNNGGCSVNATCTNSAGSFSCSCKTGYTGDGVTCTDVNECATNNGGCSVNATCTNSAGSFSCACKTGYTGNGVTCVPSGCSDGTREGFVNATQFPNIAGCSGGWSVAGLLPGITAKCGLAGGNSGANPNGNTCSAADLCETGWHVCATSLQVKNASATGGCSGSTAAGAASLFFATLQSGPGAGDCGSGTNDLFGCGNLGAAPNGSCSPLDRFSNNLCGSLAAPWSCVSANGGFDEAIKVTKSGPASGGVLCCRN
jgi:hypothetical protein